MPGNTGHRPLTGALLVLAFSTVLAAQGPPFREPGRGPDLRPPGRPGDIDILGVDLLQSGEPVLGVPFSAEAVTETVQDLADGNRIERRATSAIARDGRGRIRREQMLPAIGPASPIPNLRIVTINDPAQRVLYLLDSARKIATRSAAPPPPLRRSGTQAGQPRPSGVGRPEITTETLGTRYVAGIRAEGTRTTTTIPAGVFGNVRPMNVVSERWYSPELQVVVESRRQDPLTGEISYQLTNVERVEPPAELFQVPADYRVVDRPAPGFGPPARRAESPQRDR